MVTDLINFTITNRCNCDYSHIQRIKEVPALNVHIPCGAKNNNEDR